MYRRPAQRLWCFRAALDDLVENAARDAGGAATSGQAWRSSEQVSQALSEIGGSTANDGAGGSQISRLCFAYLADTAAATPLRTLGIEDVAAALRMKPAPNRAQLLRLRRDFAAVNHPDRLPEALRRWAATNMARVNTMIDEALLHAAIAEAAHEAPPINAVS
jgi:hypothetical protein